MDYTNYTSNKEEQLFSVDDPDAMEEKSEEDVKKKVHEMLNDPNEFLTFGDALKRFLKNSQSDYAGGDVAQYLKGKFQEKGLPLLNRNTAKNWFEEGKRPPKSQDSREKMYKMAFGLELSTQETYELFRKVYFDKPFDFRDKKELTYCYCLKNKLSYQNAEELLRLISQDNSTDTSETDMLATQYIQDCTENMQTDEDFIDFINMHSCNFGKPSRSTSQKIQYYLEEARKMATNEMPNASGLSLKKSTSTNLVSDASLMKIIYDQSFENEPVSNLQKTKPNLLKEIRENLPDKHILSKKEKRSSDENRKLLILLFSYVNWMHAKTKKISMDLEDYKAQCDSLLSECGLSTLYYGNPYDWLFLFCIQCENHVDAFRGIIEEAMSAED